MGDGVGKSEFLVSGWRTHYVQRNVLIVMLGGAKQARQATLPPLSTWPRSLTYDAPPNPAI